MKKTKKNIIKSLKDLPLDEESEKKRKIYFKKTLPGES